MLRSALASILLLLALGSSATPLDARAQQTCADANAQCLKTSPTAATKFCQSFLHMTTVTRTTTTTARPVITSIVPKVVKTITQADTTTEFELTTITSTTTLTVHPTSTCQVLADDPNHFKRSTPSQPTPRCLEGRQQAAISSACKCLKAPAPTATITKTTTLPTTILVTKSVTQTLHATSTFISTIPFFERATATITGSSTTTTQQVGSDGYYCTPGIFYREEYKTWSMGMNSGNPFIPAINKFFMCDPIDSQNGCESFDDCMNSCSENDFCNGVQYGVNTNTDGLLFCAHYNHPPSSYGVCGCQAFRDPNCVSMQFGLRSLQPPTHC